jgi:hypothetical protein
VVFALALFVCSAHFVEKRTDIMKTRKAVLISVIIIFALLLIPILSIVIPMIATPIRRTPGLVRQYILRQTPVGTSMSEVIEFIESREDWGLSDVDKEVGIILRTPHIRPDLNSHDISYFVGEMSVGASLGGYHAWYVMLGAPRVYVSARWGFDAMGNLVDVRVWKAWFA